MYKCTTNKIIYLSIYLDIQTNKTKIVVGALKGLWYRQFAPANVNVTLYVTCLGNRTVCTGPGGLLNGFSIPLWFGRRNNLTGYRKKGQNAWLPCVWDGCLLRENLTCIYYIHIHVCVYI